MPSILGPCVWAIVPAVLAMSDATAPADFKLHVEVHGVRAKSPGASAVLVVHKGIAYQFLSHQRDEVQIIDPAGPRVTLINLKRRVQTEVTSEKMESDLKRLHRAIAGAVDRRKESEDRAERVSAAMSGDLIDPNFTTTYDSSARRLRLTNATVEVEASGEPDPEPLRLKTIQGCLTTLAKLSAVRDPSGLPPFTQIETLRALMSGQHLRPTEITYLYRLAGPPRKLRWTYRLVTELTADEREAIARIDGLRSTARFVRYPSYEPDEP